MTMTAFRYRHFAKGPYTLSLVFGPLLAFAFVAVQSDEAYCELR